MLPTKLPPFLAVPTLRQASLIINPRPSLKTSFSSCAHLTINHTSIPASHRFVLPHSATCAHQCLTIGSVRLTWPLSRQLSYNGAWVHLRSTHNHSTQVPDKNQASLRPPDPQSPDSQENSVKSSPSDSLANLNRLASIARPEAKIMSIAGGMLLVSSAISLSMPFLWGRVIDVFTKPELLESFSLSLPMVAALLASGFLVGSGANTTRIILMHIAGQRIISRLRTTAFNAIMRADITWHDLQGSLSSKASSGTSRGTGDLISRLGSDCHMVGDSITRDLADGTRALTTVVAGVSMMLFISSKLTLVMLTVVPPTAIGAVIFGQYLKKLSKQTQVGLGEMVNVAEEKITNIRTVHSFNSVPIETRTFDEKVQKIFGLARKEAYARGLFFGGSGFTGNATIIALLTYGGTLVSRGEISVGDLSSLMMYTAYVGSSLVGLSSCFATVMKGLGASTRIFELLDAKPVSVTLGKGKVLNPVEPLKPVTFKDVRFEYPSRPGTEILKGLDLQIVPGTSLAIAGSSGSGKSTVAYLLMRFYDPKSGGIFYGDEDISTFTPESWRSNIGVVPQDPALLSGTVTSNITYGLSSPVAPATVEHAARLANAQGFIEALPGKYETEIGPKGIQLSGGQRQRLAIARALVRQPKLLILDEATSALDTAAENEVNLAIERVMKARNLTTVIIAHRLSTLKTADRIVFMENGKILESGSYQELSRDGTGFNKMIKSQLLGGGYSSNSSSSSSSSSNSSSGGGGGTSSDTSSNVLVNHQS